METFEVLLAAQQKTAGQIEAIIRNYKKDPTSRKTKEYYLERLHRLDTAWQEFESTDNKLRCLSNLPVQHEYFTDQYLCTSGDTLKYKELFESEIKRLSNIAIEQLESNEGASSCIQREPQIDEITSKVLRNQRALTRALRRTMDEAMAEEITERAQYQAKLTLIDKYMGDLSRNNDMLWQLTTKEKIDGYTLDDFYKTRSAQH